MVSTVEEPSRLEGIAVERIVREGDIDPLDEKRMQLWTKGVALDLETTALEPVEGTIEVVSLSGGVGYPLVVLVDKNQPPKRLQRYFDTFDRQQVLIHNAVFDCRWMRFHWGWEFGPGRVLDTRIAAKLLRLEQASLQWLCRAYLGVTLDKSLELRTEGWDKRPLTARQLRYAIDDVRHLHNLMFQLANELVALSRWREYEKILAYLPVRVEHEVLGLGDIFSYP